MVEDGRITGLAFTRYNQTLSDRVRNLQRLLDKKKCLEAIENGIHHLHSLRFVHNDVSVENVMFSDDDVPVIIDFDSCRREGEKMDVITARICGQTISMTMTIREEKMTSQACANLASFLITLKALVGFDKQSRWPGEMLVGSGCGQNPRKYVGVGSFCVHDTLSEIVRPYQFCYRGVSVLRLVHGKGYLPTIQSFI